MVEVGMCKMSGCGRVEERSSILSTSNESTGSGLYYCFRSVVGTGVSARGEHSADYHAMTTMGLLNGWSGYV